MKQLNVDGEIKYVNDFLRHGDVLIIDGFSSSKAQVIWAEGTIRSSNVYCKLIEAFALYSKGEENLELHLDIPNIVKENVRAWMEKNNISEKIMFVTLSEKEKDSKYYDNIKEKIIMRPGFGNNYYMVSKSMVVPGTVEAVVDYLESVGANWYE